MGLKELTWAVELPPEVKKQIGLAAFALLFAGKCNHTDHEHRTWELISSQQEATGLSRHGVVKATKKLVEAGLIRRVDYKYHPHQRSISYEINVHGVVVSRGNRVACQWPDEIVDNPTPTGNRVYLDRQLCETEEATQLPPTGNSVAPTHSITNLSNKQSDNLSSNQEAKSDVQKSPPRKSKPGGSEKEPVKPEDVWNPTAKKLAVSLCGYDWRVRGTEDYAYAEKWMGLILSLLEEFRAGRLDFGTIRALADEALSRSKDTEPEATRIVDRGAWFASAIDRLRAQTKRGDVAPTGSGGPRRALEAFRQGTADGADTEEAA